jgi:hypothetical protein
MQLRRTGWIGLVMIGMSLVTLACWTAWFRTRTWSPVEMPVSLLQGSRFSTNEFSINLNAEYRIEIDAKNKIPLETLGCLLGNGMRSTCAVPSVVGLHWVLSTDGTVRQGTSDDTKGYGGESESDGEAFRTIGFFKGQKGRLYKLDFDVLADGSSLAITNPQLRVSALNSSFESALVLGGLLRLICMIIGLVGVVLLVASVLSQRRGSPPLPDPRPGPV